MNHDSTGPVSRPPSTAEIANHAAEAIRTLNHLTQPIAAANIIPAEIDRTVATLACTADRLPQLLRQLAGLLQTQQQAGMLRIDATCATPDVATAVDAATSALQEASAHASGSSRSLDIAHRVLAYLAASRTAHDAQANAGRQPTQMRPPNHTIVDRSPELPAQGHRRDSRKSQTDRSVDAALARDGYFSPGVGHVCVVKLDYPALLCAAVGAPPATRPPGTPGPNTASP